MSCYDPRCSDRQEGIKEVANHILYVDGKMGYAYLTDPKIVQYTSIDERMIEERYFDVFTRTLCRTLNVLKKKDLTKFEQIVFNANCKESRRLADWWEEQREFDKEILTNINNKESGE